MGKTNHETHVKLHMQALANSMMQTKETLVGAILGNAFGEYANVAATTNSWEIEVNFND